MDFWDLRGGVKVSEPVDSRKASWSHFKVVRLGIFNYKLKYIFKCDLRTSWQNWYEPAKFVLLSWHENWAYSWFSYILDWRFCHGRATLRATGNWLLWCFCCCFPQEMYHTSQATEVWCHANVNKRKILGYPLFSTFLQFFFVEFANGSRLPCDCCRVPVALILICLFCPLLLICWPSCLHAVEIISLFSS